MKRDDYQGLRVGPIVIGIGAGTLLAINRLLTPQITDFQTRSDALGVILSALLILTGLLWQRIQPKPPEAVELIGTEDFELDGSLPEIVKTELAWASHLLLTNTSTKTIIVWYAGQTLLRRGILPVNKLVNLGTITERVLAKQKPIYLVDLKLYPGRIEFDYLPANTQGVICQNLGDRGLLILGSNAPRSYTQQDENWITGIAEKLDNTLKTTNC